MLFKQQEQDELSRVCLKYLHAFDYAWSRTEAGPLLKIIGMKVRRNRPGRRPMSASFNDLILVGEVGLEPTKA
jgi:hypothetical protein